MEIKPGQRWLSSSNTDAAVLEIIKNSSPNSPNWYICYNYSDNSTRESCFCKSCDKIYLEGQDKPE
jgi:hypothetical protein